MKKLIALLLVVMMVALCAFACTKAPAATDEPAAEEPAAEEPAGETPAEEPAEEEPAFNPGLWAQEAGFVGSGPFILESWTHDESMVYVKNPNYWDAENVKIDRIEFMLSADDTAILAAYNNGDLDFADTVPTDAIAGLLGTPEFYTVDELGTYYVVFNVNSPLFEGKTPEQANAMRKAFSRLIDREYIAETVGQTGQVPATSFIPAKMADGNGGIFKDAAGWNYPVEDGYYPLEPDVDAAIALLEEAGFTFTDGKLDDSNPISFEYLTNDTSGHIAVAECVQQDLAVVGIDMTIRSIDWATFLDERKAGNYDIARNGWIADFNDPINMLEMWLTESGNNDAQFGRFPENPATPDWTGYDALIQQIYAETDFAKRAELMHQAEDMLEETGALMSIYYYNDIYMMKPSMTGMYSNVFGTKFFQYCDIEANADGEKVLRINLSSEPAYLDPALNSSVDGACLAAANFGGLYTYDAAGNTVPNYAVSHTMSEDGLTYVFTMREGLTWSDGTPLTAKDFEYSWNRAINPETAADYAYMYAPIASFEASEDGTTLTVHLNTPCAYMLDLMAFPTFYAVPQTAIEAALAAN